MLFQLLLYLSYVSTFEGCESSEFDASNEHKQEYRSGQQGA